MTAAAVTTGVPSIEATISRAVVVAVSMVAGRIRTNRCARTTVREAGTRLMSPGAKHNYCDERHQECYCYHSNHHRTTSTIVTLPNFLLNRISAAMCHLKIELYGVSHL
jgi:hypothetical protein